MNNLPKYFNSYSFICFHFSGKSKVDMFGSLIIIIIYKAFYGILLYFFYKFIQVNKSFIPFKHNLIKQEENNALIYSFASFYFIDRLLSWLFIISFFRAKCSAVLINILMTLLHLGEIHLIFSKSGFQQGEISQKRIYPILISQVSFPLYFIVFSWYFNNNYGQLDTVLVAILLANLNFLICSMLLGFFMNYDIYFRGYVQSLNQTPLFEFIYSYIQITSYLALIVFNKENFQNFLGFFGIISLVFVLLSFFIQKQIHSKWRSFKLSYSFLMKQILNIIPDHRYILSKGSLHSMIQLSPKQFNMNNLFSLLIQSFLISNYFKMIANENHSDSGFEIFMVLLSMLCALILLYRFTHQIFTSSYKELGSEKSFCKYIQQYVTTKKPSNTMNKVIYARFLATYEFIKSSGFKILVEHDERNEIIFLNCERSLHSRFHLSYKINLIQLLMPSQVVLELIQTSNLISNIFFMKLTFIDLEKEEEILKIMAQKYPLVQLIYNNQQSQNLKLYEAHNKSIKEIQKTVLQFLTYKENISSHQLINSNLIFYDLFDS